MDISDIENERKLNFISAKRVYTMEKCISQFEPLSLRKNRHLYPFTISFTDPKNMDLYLKIAIQI